MFLKKLFKQVTALRHAHVSAKCVRYLLVLIERTPGLRYKALR